MEENYLYDRLNVLQAKMLDFREKISPAKQMEHIQYEEESKFSSACKVIIVSLMKIFMCITGPLIFPTVIYYIEGNTQLFWQATAVCCTISVLLVMMVISILCVNVKKIKCVCEDAIASLKVLAKTSPVLLNFTKDLNPDFLLKSAYRLLFPMIMLFLIGVVALLAYVKRMQLLFNVSLIIVGFVGGIIFSTVCDVMAGTGTLPLHGPNIKAELSEPLPRAKRELKFTSLVESSPILSLARINSPLIQNEFGFGRIDVANTMSEEKSPSCFETKRTLFPENLKFFRL